MLTLFAIPKGFRDHTGIIQRNAIRSWTLLQPGPEILLFGDDEGTEQVAQEMKVNYVAEVARNRYGTPLISDIFSKAHALASNPLLAYVNADIILMNDFLEAVRRAVQKMDRFLLVAQRWDLDQNQPCDFGAGWEERMRLKLQQVGQLHCNRAMDILVFPKGIADEMPPFAVGRPAWDNWFLFRARSRLYPVIDVTPIVTIVHQNHHYGHVPLGTGDRWEGPEAQENRRLAGGFEYLFTMDDANLILTSQGFQKPNWTKARILRSVYARAVLSPTKSIWSRFAKLLFASRSIEDYLPKLKRLFSIR